MTKVLTPEEKAAGKKTVEFSAPITKEEKERLQAGEKIAKETTESFIRDARCYEKTYGERERLTYAFFPEEQKKRTTVRIENEKEGITLVRDMPTYYAVAHMLQEGIPYEEVLDPTKHTERRLAIGKNLREKVPNMTADEFDRMHIDCMRTMAGVVDKFAEKMSGEIKSSKDITEKFPQLNLGTLFVYTIGMDQFKNKAKAIEYCGGQKAFNTLVSKLEETYAPYSMFLSQKKTLNKYYQVLRGGKEFNLEKDIREKVQKAAILQGLRSKQPNLHNQVTTNEFFLVEAIVKDHPEVKTFQEKMRGMDREFLKDWLVTGGENQAHLKLEVLESEVPNKTKIGNYKPGMMPLRVNVIINDKKLTELDGPEKEEDMAL